MFAKLIGYYIHIDGIGIRIQNFKEWQAKIDETEGGLDPFSKGYEKFGLIAQADRSILYREWAPGAQNASLIGDFNNWDREANPMKKDQFGVWECRVPPKGSQPGIAHGSKVKVCDFILAAVIKMFKSP
jgi:1,4-alpha-glucan branching enzyme